MVTGIREKNILLAKVLCIYYSIQFRKDPNGIQVLLNSGNEVNAINPAYTLRLSLQVHYTNIRAQKIDGSTLEIFGMVLANFQVEDKLGKIWFFQETFLLANISTKVVLDMPFLILSNANVQFVEKELT